MDERKKVKKSLLIIFFIIYIIVMTIMGIIIFKVLEEKTNEEEKIENLNSEIKELEKTINGEQEEINSTANTIDNHTINSDITSGKEKFNEGTYCFSLEENNNIFANYNDNYANINFLNNEFTAEFLSNMAINGKYEVLENGKLRCNIISCTFNKNQSKNAILVKEGNYAIDFIIENDQEIKVDAKHFGENNSEINIILSQIFVEGYRFVSYNLSDFIGEWKSVEAACYEEAIQSWIKKDLKDILGSEYVRIGSTFIFNNDNIFQDYVFPVTEGDKHRNGTYTFDGINKFTLKYSDDDIYNVEIHIMNKNKIVYKNGDNIIFMNK